VNLEIPHLAFLPVEMLLIHERHDNQRTLPLVQRMRSSGVFRNPPIVTPLGDGSGRYMVLDGANRATALRQLGFPHCLAQVVQPDDPGLKLFNWNHIVWELSPERFMEGLIAIDGLSLHPELDRQVQPELYGECGLAIVQLLTGEVYSVRCGEQSLEGRVAALNAIADSYRERARLDRTSADDILPLAHIYPNLGGLVNFPNFSLQDILALAARGGHLPSGVTRFTIAPRVLHLNYPLVELESPRSVEEKNADLDRWIKDKLARKHVRYYAEPTILFDE
jgi:hypothetical protein